MAGKFSNLTLGTRSLEFAWFGDVETKIADTTVLVFLHQGLGCLELWRDYPDRLARITGLPCFVYSRFGYGGSSSCEIPRPISYMHEEGIDILPELLSIVGIRRHILIGHSDGASISIAYAGGTQAKGLLGAVLEAPHVFTETINVRSVKSALKDYENGDLKRRLEKYHGSNADSAVRGWSSAWLNKEFSSWSLEEYLPNIKIPLLIIQGDEDKYGTKAQPDTIARLCGGQSRVLILPKCGHSPHQECPEITLRSTGEFIRRVTSDRTSTIV